MFDQVAICIRLEVARDALETLKQIAGIDLEKAVNADVTNISLIAIQAVPDIAVFFYVLTTGALIEILSYLDSRKLPLSTRHIETV
ncbi:hypothetical protein C4K14_2331 [Pseudomonas chlororaphis subsp. aureofaciens]|nr:hypothetical protein C4K14_2331 [Pseudomonas chlororaphis subsp. aureofaciens]